MNIHRNAYHVNKTVIPTIEIVPDNFAAEIVVIHSYGGSKEEILGFGFRLAEDNYKCTSIDLRGHGENKSIYDDLLLEDINALLCTIKKDKPMVAIGHSLGGHLALLSDADIKVGISPALEKSYSDQTVKIIKAMRQHRVREINGDINFDYIKKLPSVDGNLTDRDLIVYSKRDVPEIMNYVLHLKNVFKNIVEVDRAVHGDMFLSEDVIGTIKSHLKRCLVL